MIPARTQIIVTLFLCFWLALWAVGWLSAFGMMLGAGSASVFVFGWLCAWTLGGAVAASFVMWNLMGEERIGLDLDEAEARKMVDFVHNRFPQLAGRA